MEERQRLGLDPFAPPCDIIDPGPLPVYPIIAAKRSVDLLLADQESFRNRVRLGLPTGELQLPDLVSPALFDRIAASVTDGDAMRAASKDYFREAYDANEMLQFARAAKADGRPDQDVCALIDASIAAAQRSADALVRIVALLPAGAVASQGQPTKGPVRQRKE